MTTSDDQIIARARRRLLVPGEHSEWDHQIAARDALAIIVASIREQDDAELTVYAALAMPAWDGPSGMWPAVEGGPLLDLLEVAT